jgi:hypothetical protein
MTLPRFVRVLLWCAAAIPAGALSAQSLVEGGWGPRLIPVQPDQLPVAIHASAPRFAHPEPPLFVGPGNVKGLYVNAWAFSSPKLWHLARLVDSTEINALVIDVKDDTGCLLYPSKVPTAIEIGASACARTKSAPERLDTLRAHHVYLIARIVVAKDPLLAERKPEWSVKDRAGGLWRDRINIAWVDAYNDSVWIYAAQLAREAIEKGFNEVQFDYVRFPDEPREKLAQAIFPAKRPGDDERSAVRRQVRMLADRVRAAGAPVTFDIFGLTASTKGSDLGIGQVWEDFAAVADVLLPMVYPSHYYKGAFGYEHPNAQPYRIVHDALRDALERSRAFPNSATIRPFLQAFTLGRRKPRYTPVEIRAQIRAAEELGITSWVLWNPRSVYQRDALLPPRSTGRAAETVPAGGE